MPTVHTEKGIDFRFYASDMGEPPHIHAVKGNKNAKIWLNDMSFAYNRGFRLAIFRELPNPDGKCFWRPGMHSSTELTITSAKLTGNNLVVFFNDGRVVFYPIAGMTWITDAPQEKHQDFTVTEWEIYWNQIDDGITLEHILSPNPRVDFTQEKKPNWEKVYQVVEKHKATASLESEEIVQ